MAAPPSRRPGFSRKAYYGLFLGYVIAVGGVLFAILCLVLAVVDPRGFNALKGMALDVTTPVTSGARSAVQIVTGSGEAAAAYWRAASQNEAMRQRLRATERRLVEADALELENRRLKRLLSLTSSVDDEIGTARIVGSTFDSSRRLATITIGRRAGVEVGQPVRSPEGLIGRVLETGLFASRVLLISDGASTVPVQQVRTGLPALATGRGDGLVELKTLEVGQNPFRRGDVVVTSGVGGIYPPGVPVARVTAAGRDATIARPLADPSRVPYAIVQRVYVPETAHPIEPVAVPSPAPTPGAAPAPPAAEED